jgi:hypothetical protein
MKVESTPLAALGMTTLVEGNQPKRNVKERWHKSQRYI